MEEFKIMTADDVEDVFAFEMLRVSGQGIEKEMKGWHAPWRREALDHYAKLGWSFIKREDGKLAGYVLCQPFLFFQSWTQSLWIEHVNAVHPVDATYLLEVAYRWSRDKHLQKVFYKKSLPFADTIAFATPEVDGEFVSIKTTKM